MRRPIRPLFLGVCLSVVGTTFLSGELAADEQLHPLDELWLADGVADAEPIGLNGPQVGSGESHELHTGDVAELSAANILAALDDLRATGIPASGSSTPGFELWHLADVRLIDPAVSLGSLDIEQRVSVPPLYFVREAHYSAATRTLHVDFYLQHVPDDAAVPRDESEEPALLAAIERLTDLATIDLVAAGPLVLAEVD